MFFNPNRNKRTPASTLINTAYFTLGSIEFQGKFSLKKLKRAGILRDQESHDSYDSSEQRCDRLTIEIQPKLHRVWVLIDNASFFVAFMLDPYTNGIFGKDIAAQQESMILFKGI